MLLTGPFSREEYMSNFLRVLSGVDTVVAVQGSNADIPPQKDKDEKTLPEIDKELDSLESQLNQLVSLSAYTDTINHIGMTPAIKDLGLRLHYLSSTVASVETFSDDQVCAVVENLAADAMEKMKEWCADALATLNKTTNAVKVKLGYNIHTVDDTSLQAQARLTENSTTLTDKIKAHPYATVALCLAAVAAVAALVPVFAGAIPAAAAVGGEGATAAVTNGATFSRLIAGVKAIKWPFGTFDLTTAGSHISLKYTATKKFMTALRTAPVGTIKDLGWTQATVKTVTTQVNKLATTFPRLSNMVVTQYRKELDYATKNLTTPGFFKKIKGAAKVGFRASVYLPFVTMGWSIIKAVFTLIKEVVFGTVRIIKHAVTAIAGRGAKVQDTESASKEGELV